MLDHGKVEKNLGLMLVMVLLAISMGGLVEIVPMFFIKGTIEDVKTPEGVKMVHPYTALEQRGRDIYIREVDEKSEQFGIERLSHIVERMHQEPAERIRDRIMAEVAGWRHTQEDDETLLVLRFSAPDARAAQSE